MASPSPALACHVTKEELIAENISIFADCSL
jgi:hypothetical protein